MFQTSYGCNGVFDHNHFLVDVAYCTGSRGNVCGKHEHELNGAHYLPVTVIYLLWSYVCTGNPFLFVGDWCGWVFFLFWCGWVTLQIFVSTEPKWFKLIKKKKEKKKKKKRSTIKTKLTEPKWFKLMKRKKGIQLNTKLHPLGEIKWQKKTIKLFHFCHKHSQPGQFMNQKFAAVLNSCIRH